MIIRDFLTKKIFPFWKFAKREILGPSQKKVPLKFTFDFGVRVKDTFEIVRVTIILN